MSLLVPNVSLFYSLKADGEVDIKCGAIAVVALLPATEPSDEGGGYTGKNKIL